MDRFQEELDLEEIFRTNQIASPDEFSKRLKEVYEVVNGDIGNGIFNNNVLPTLLRIHGSDFSAAGLEALALLFNVSYRPSPEVAPFLEGWVEGRTTHPNQNSPDSLESIALGSPEEGANLTNPNYTLPILLYTDDSRFKVPSANWTSPVYKSSTVNRRHQLTFTKNITRKKPSIEIVIGAESARITGGYRVWYTGEINSNTFDVKKGNDPLIIVYGLVSEVGYKHASDNEYGFLYGVTSQGTRKHVRRYNKTLIVPAVTAVFAVLPRQNYDEMVQNQFRNVEQFVLNTLPDPWKAYLTEGGFFSKPRVIGRIDAKSPHLNYGASFR